MAEAISQEVLARARQLQAQALAEQEAQRRAAAEAAALEAERNRSNTWGEAALNVPVQLLSGAVGLGQAAYGLGNMATLGVLDRVAGLSGNFQETQNILSSWQSAPTQRAAEDVQTAFQNEGVVSGLGEAITSPAFLQQLVVGNLPSLLPGAAAARAGAAAGAANAAARGLTGEAAGAVATQTAQRALGRAVGGQVAGAVNVDTINAVDEAGGSELQGQLGGLGAGALAGLAAPLLMRATGAGALEAAAANALPGGTALGLGAGGVARNVLGGVVREAAEEAPQSASERIAQNIFTPGADVFEGVGQAAALGGLAGGLLGGGMGGAISMRSLRASADTPLGQEVSQQLAQANSAEGEPLATSPLSDVETRPGLLGVLDRMGHTARVDQQRAAAEPTPPATGLFAAMERARLNQQFAGGEQIELTDAVLPSPIVDELPLGQSIELTGTSDDLTPFARNQLRAAGMTDDQIAGMTAAQVAAAQATLGAGQAEQVDVPGVDLFGGALAPEGAFPQGSTEQQLADTPAPAAAPGQQAIDFDAPAPTWKKSLARELDLKPQHFRGKVWQDFEAAAKAAGVDPLSPNASEFLATIAPQLAADPATAPLFAARLYDKYAAAPVEPERSAAAPMEDADPAADDGLNNEMDAVAPTQGAEPGDRGSATPKIDAWLDRFRAQSAAREVAAEPGDRGGVTAPEEDIGQYMNRVAAEQDAELVAAYPKLAAAAELAGVSATGVSKYLTELERQAMSPQAMADAYAEREAAHWAELRVKLKEDQQRFKQEARQIIADDSAQGLELLEAIEILSGEPETQVPVRHAANDAMRLAPANDAPALPRVTGSKQVRGGYTEGTYHEVSLSDGRTARIFRQQGDGGVMLSGWILSEVDNQSVGGNQGIYLGETKADALRELPSRLPAKPPTNFAEPQPIVGIDQIIARNMAMDPSSDRKQAAADAFGDLIMDAPSSDVLDEYFIAIKAHADWAKLTEPQRDQLINDFNLRYDALENGTARFDRAEPGTKVVPMDLSEFSKAISAANSSRPAGSPEIVPVEDVASFEAMTGHAAPPDARGVFADDKVYLIRENLANGEQMALTLAHERGHAGLAALLGDRLPAVVNRLWTNAATRTRIKAKMHELAGTTDPEQGGLRRLAAEEVLADMLAGGEKVNGDVLTKARSAVENAFASMLGYSKLTMTNEQVDALLRDTAVVAKGTSPAALNRDAGHLQGLEFAMNDPASWLAGDARFSRAVADIDEVIAAASTEGDGTRRNIADVAKGTGLDALQKVKSLGTATAADKARAVALDAVPLNQLANLYDKYFSGKLGEFARLKRGKEAAFNKSITSPQKLNFMGEALGEVSPMATANKLRAFSHKNPARMQAWNQTQQIATLYRLWPHKSLADQSDLKYESMGFTADERAEAHRQLQKLWNSIGDEGRTLYKETQAIYSFMWNARFSALKADIARVMAPRTENGEPMPAEQFYKTKEFKAAYGDRIDAAVKKLNNGPYSPLQRYGDYMVTVRDKAGRVAWFSGHDTIEEANQIRQELVNGDFAGDGYVVSAPTLRRSQNWEQDGISQSTIEAIEKSVDGLVSMNDQPELHRQIRQGLVEAYLQSLPQGSFLQHANRRKNTKGATTDAFRAFSDYTIKAGRSIASLRYDGPITAKLAELQTVASDNANDADGIKRQRVLEAVKRQHQASLRQDRSPVADALSQAGFLWFLSSPSQLLINSMQTPMVTLPRLAGSYGSGAALRGVKQALADFAKSRGDMLGAKSTLAADSVERQVLQELFERGTLDFTLSHDMASLAAGDVGTSMSGGWRKALEIGGMFMHRSEVFNRQVVALAATRLEMQKRRINGQATPAQLEEIANVADAATLTTQFDYSQSNKPTVMQGPWRKVVFQFQQYRVNMLAMMGKDIRDSFSGTPEEKKVARRALAWQLGTQLALTGAAGTVLAPIAFFIADAFRDDDDLLDSRTEFVRAAPQWLAHGLLAGAVDLSRVGADGLVSFGGNYAPVDASAKETFQYYVLQNLGPWAGLGANLFTGIEKAMNGDHVAAVKNLAPAGARDVYKAYFEGQQGAKDSRQIVYYEPNMWDTVAGAMGIRSGGRREAEEKRGAAYEATIRAQTVKQRYMGRLALGHATSDQEMIDEAMENITRWNSEYPDLGFKGSDIKRAIVTRYRTQMNALEYGVAGNRPPSASIQAAVRL